MARGRMISNSLSTSEKFAALVSATPSLFEFCHALYPLLVCHTDDFGRLQGDAFTVKAKCYPATPRPLADVEQGLQQLDAVGLIAWYCVSGKRFIQIVEFEKHQQGLHKRTRSQFPRIPGSSGKDEELPGQLKGTEEKRTELKGREENKEEIQLVSNSSDVVARVLAAKKKHFGRAKPHAGYRVR